MEKGKFLKLFTLLLAVNLFGIAGYTILEGWGLSDALYMTIITLTTTGFQEVHELSDSGRVFTMVLLLTGVGTFAYALSAMMDTVALSNFLDRRKTRMIKKISQLSGHVIICGFGRMGSVIAKNLQDADIQFVVVEKREQQIKELESLGYFLLEGNAADDENLQHAGISNAKYLISMLDDDADGLYLTLAAKSLNPNIHIVARANNEMARKRMIMAGADKVILPLIMAGERIAEGIVHPEVGDFMEITIGEDNNGVKKKRLELVEIEVEKGSALENRTLRSCGIRRDGLIVVGIRKPDSTFMFAPEADDIFSAGDRLIALGTRESYETTKRKMGI